MKNNDSRISCIYEESSRYDCSAMMMDEISFITGV